MDAVPARIGRFVVLRELGAGAMGIVYSAFDEELDRKVAVKVLQRGLVGGTQGRERFMREAQALARLSHPNVVHVYEVGQLDDQIHIVMEFVAGEDGRAWARETRDWADVVGVYLDAGRGLAAAHRSGLVHRDFKPANIIVSADGRTRVLDFGLARAVGDVESDPQERSGTPDRRDERLTRTGAMMGTPAYMAPEVFEGEPADMQSDQFSFCLALYETVYGTRPFGPVTDVESVRRTLSGELLPAPPKSSVPAWLRRILVRGLRSDPRQRFPSMDALVAEIEKHLRRGRRSLPVLAVGLIAAVGAGFWWGGLAGDELCSGGEAQIGSVWNDGVEHQLDAVFDGVEAPFAADAWRSTRGQVDGYARQWALAHREACEATQVRGEQSEARLDLRIACLEQALRALESQLRTFEAADATVAERLRDMVGGLPEIEACDEPPAHPLPAAHERERVEAVRTGIAMAKAWAGAGKYELAKASLAEAEASQQGLAYEGTVAALELVRADVEDAVGDIGVAIEALTRAYFKAIELRDTAAAAEAAVALVEAHIGKSSLGDATAWSRHATALVAATGDARLEQRLWRTLGLLHLEKGMFDPAREALERAVQDAANPLARAAALTALAEAHREQGDWRTANALGEEGYALLVEEYGETHPASIRALSNIGFTLLKQGRVEDAWVALDRAASQSIAAFGERSRSTATIMNNIAGVLQREKRYEEAIVYLKRVHEIRREVLGEHHALTAHPLNNLGNAYVGLMRYDEAETYYRRALEILSKALGPDHPHVAFPLNGLADVAGRRERWRESAKHFEEVIAIREKHGAAPEALGGTRYQLAETLYHLEEERPRAVQIARDELARIEALDERSPDLDALRSDLHRFIERTAGRGAPPTAG